MVKLKKKKKNRFKHTTIGNTLQRDELCMTTKRSWKSVLCERSVKLKGKFDRTSLNMLRVGGWLSEIKVVLFFHPMAIQHNKGRQTARQIDRERYTYTVATPSYGMCSRSFKYAGSSLSYFSY